MGLDLAAMSRQIEERGERLKRALDAPELAALLAESDALEAALKRERSEIVAALQGLGRLAEFRDRLRLAAPPARLLDQVG